jgi:predicted transcriptional regulator
MSMKHFLFKKKPSMLLLCLKDTSQAWYPSKLARSCNTSYVYVTHWIEKLEKQGWIKVERKGKLKNIIATEAGAGVIASLDELMRKINAFESKNAASPQEGGEVRKKEAKDLGKEEKERKEQGKNS